MLLRVSFCVPHKFNLEAPLGFVSKLVAGVPDFGTRLGKPEFWRIQLRVRDYFLSIETKPSSGRGWVIQHHWRLGVRMVSWSSSQRRDREIQ